MMALRQTAWMPRLVNSDYSTDAAKKGSTIDIPIPSALTATDVTPAPTLTPSDSTPTTTQIQLNSWKRVTFHLTDKDYAEIDANAAFVPMQLTEAMKALGNAVNQSIWDAYKKVYGYTGIAGTTPFASNYDSALDVRKILADQLCPKGERRFVVDNTAEVNLLKLAPFRDASQSADARVIAEGEIGRKLGFDWFADDAVPLHTAGTGSGYLVNNGSGLAIGAKTAAVDTGTGTLVEGDIIFFAGHAQSYVITAAYAGGAGTIAFEPALVATVADNAAIAKVATHRVNLAFHRDAIGFANRSMASELDRMSPNPTWTVQDPKTLLVFRAELIRQAKQWVWDFDILYGAGIARRELACRLGG
jgi:hypothetical protein